MSSTNAFHEQAIGEIPAGTAFKAWIAAGDHVAWAGAQDGKWTVMLDGKQQGGTYRDVEYLTLSPDGLHLHFFGKLHDGWVHVFDGNETSHGYASVTAISLQPQSGSFAYGACVRKNSCQLGANVLPRFHKLKIDATVVLDGRPGQTYEGSGMGSVWTTVVLGEIQVAPKGVLDLLANFFGVSGPTFSPDGRLAHAVRRGKGDVVVTFGEEAGPALDELLSPILFSRDTKHSAYVGARGDSFLEVRDNQPRKTFPIGARVGLVDWGVMSADGSRFAYELVRGGVDFMNRATTRARRSVVLGGQPGREYNADSIGMPLFTGDSRHYLYPVVRVDGKYDLVVADGTESNPYDEITDLHLSSDGTSAIFLARDSSRLLRVTHPLQ